MNWKWGGGGGGGDKVKYKQHGYECSLIEPKRVIGYCTLERSVNARAPSSKVGSHGIYITDDLTGPTTL